MHSPLDNPGPRHSTRGRGAQLRLQFQGAIYHVMHRRAHQEPIFRGPRDRELFLKTLGEACAKTDWQVHVWA